MLVELRIRNFALIDGVDLEFGSSLNLLTGETGAGKSILIDALGLVLGERSSGTDAIRSGADRLTVDAVFDVSAMLGVLKSSLDENAIELEDDRFLLVSRDLSRGNARSSCRINGRPYPVSVLKELGERLVDVHGQHEHQALLNPERHLDLLDSWAGDDAEAGRSKVAAALSALNSIRREITTIERDSRESERLIDLYQYQVEEIESAKLRVGEEQEIAVERDRLVNAEKISQSVMTAYTLVNGADDSIGAIAALEQAVAALTPTLQWDANLCTVLDNLQSAAALAEDAAGELRHYPDALEYDAGRLDVIDDRLTAIKKLKKKYGETELEIIEFGQATKAKLNALQNSSDRLSELHLEVSKAETILNRVCNDLTKIRRRTADDFSSMIARELTDLGMAATKFAIAFSDSQPTAKGTDRVEFMISANPGEPLRPLAKIASGGEMSRIMLAIKSVLVRSGSGATMVFDEIDVGVGGRTGEIIGRKLQALSERAQILCITHLPQIASRPGRHYFIEKTQTDDRTTVSVVEVSGEARTNEIVRMLGGSRRSEAVVQNARELLQSA